MRQTCTASLFMLLLVTGCSTSQTETQWAAPVEPAAHSSWRPRSGARGPASDAQLDQAAVERHDKIQGVVTQHSDAIRKCYDNAAKRNPKLAGKMIFEWTLNSDGTVKLARVANATMFDEEMETCMLSEMRTWQFPPVEIRGKGPLESVVTYPFYFRQDVKPRRSHSTRTI